MATLTRPNPAQYIEDNIAILETFFIEGEGWHCNDETFEVYFDRWLSNRSEESLIELIDSAK